jgi:two-component system, cell cycle response regulator DivK
MARDRILIVDDNAINLKVLYLTLTVAGYEVRTAVDAESALAVLQSFRARLVLMDLQLPGMDGFDLTRQLKSDPVMREAIIIACTAHAMKGDEQRALAIGCNGYLAKPIDTRTLAATVESYLGGPA